MDYGLNDTSEEWKDGIRKYIITMWKDFNKDCQPLNFDQYLQRAQIFKRQIENLGNFIEFAATMHFDIAQKQKLKGQGVQDQGSYYINEALINIQIVRDKRRINGAPFAEITDEQIINLDEAIKNEIFFS